MSVHDSKTRRGRVPPKFSPGGVVALMLLSPNIFLTQRQSSVSQFSSFIFSTLPLEVVGDNKPGADGADGRPPNNLVAPLE